MTTLRKGAGKAGAQERSPLIPLYARGTETGVSPFTQGGDGNRGFPVCARGTETGAKRGWAKIRAGKRYARAGARELREKIQFMAARREKGRKKENYIKKNTFFKENIENFRVNLLILFALCSIIGNAKNGYGVLLCRFSRVFGIFGAREHAPSPAKAET